MKKSGYWLVPLVFACIIVAGSCLVSLLEGGEDVSALVLGPPAYAGEMTPELTPVQRGRGKAQLCTRCHGRLGMARAAQARKWPGTVAEFVEFNLLQFRSGKRMQAVMNAVAAPLSDLDIQDVAIWYQSMSGAADKKPLSE